MESSTCIGYWSEDIRLAMLATVIWLPKPTTLSRIVCLKPRITLTVTIITARPMATPAVAMRMAGLATF